MKIVDIVNGVLPAIDYAVKGNEPEEIIVYFKPCDGIVISKYIVVYDVPRYFRIDVECNNKRFNIIYEQLFDGTGNKKVIVQNSNNRNIPFDSTTTVKDVLDSV